ncbi:UDP-3-O-(3-hydroxymyristoyl)glucosamine N-acyltransferase [bacterium]|nr:UDP-3-O-(3-hydroxymyristoyl)glucosamine N-acyltransferase [bacterium]MDC0278565.1 UDP-3-O-(3-hydroxymyristoyl)glucosamine N-acyltransferase [bacterium]
MSLILGEFAEQVGGTLAGPANLECHGANPPDDASAGDITMLDSSGRVELLQDCAASAVITPIKIPDLAIAQIVVADHHAAFAQAVKHFRPPLQVNCIASGISKSAKVAETADVHPRAIIGDNVTIGERTKIYPGVVIMPETYIGDDCIVYPNVTIYEYTQISDRVVIHAACTIGANGFGYRQENGRHIPAAQLGYVAIEADVEIGASATIDRGSYGATRIGEGTKIDNQVMIAHNCRIGRHNLICSQVGIAGSSNTGDYVVLAGQVGLKDHITLGDHSIVGAQAGVMDDCEGNEVYLGSPATPQREQMQIMAVERRLPEMRREMKALRREIEELKNAAEGPKPAAAKPEQQTPQASSDQKQVA